MKGIPAGVSRKTNKPYNAFYKCEGCGSTENVGKPQAQGGFTETDRKVLYAIYKKVEGIESIMAIGTPESEPKPSDPF